MSPLICHIDSAQRPQLYHAHVQLISTTPDPTYTTTTSLDDNAPTHKINPTQTTAPTFPQQTNRTEPNPVQTAPARTTRLTTAVKTPTKRPAVLWLSMSGNSPKRLRSVKYDADRMDP